jgi:nucleoside-diphosphate-sugar epimerase
LTAAFVTGGSGFIGGALIRRLVADRWDVHALVRSEASAQKVTGLGAHAIAGDLADVPSMAVGAQYCEVAFHCAAHLGDWGTREEFERGNVHGTQNALAAARQAGLRRFVHVGTEAALLAGQPLVEVDERAPLRFDSPALYSSTKARAEEAVIEANHNGLETVVVRPRFVWGPGDTTLLPLLAEAVRSGRFAWIGGGHHRTSTTHIDNTVQGLMLAAQRGAPGGVYFVTDGEPVVFRDFITRLLATQGIDAPTRSVPAPVARAVAATCEAAWRLLQLSGHPPLTRLAVWVSGMETTIDITRAREELGYAPVKTIDQGLEELGRS